MLMKEIVHNITKIINQLKKRKIKNLKKKKNCEII